MLKCLSRNSFIFSYKNLKRDSFEDKIFYLENKRVQIERQIKKFFDIIFGRTEAYMALLFEFSPMLVIQG